MTDRPALFACESPPRTKITNYPEPFAARVGGRLKRPLGDLFGLHNFGVNLTRLAPGAVLLLCIIDTRGRMSSFMFLRAKRRCLPTTARHAPARHGGGFSRQRNGTSPGE